MLTSMCRIGRLCPSYRRVDAKSNAKRAPVLYRDGTQDDGTGRVPIPKAELEW